MTTPAAQGPEHAAQGPPHARAHPPVQGVEGLTQASAPGARGAAHAAEPPVQPVPAVGHPRPVRLPLQLPIAEAAAHLGVSAATVRRRLKRGELRARRRVLPGGYQLLVELEAPATADAAAAAPEPDLERTEAETAAVREADAPSAETPPPSSAQVDASPAESGGRLESLIDELRRRADDQAAELTRLHERLAAVEADARAERDAHHKQLTAALLLLGHRLALEAGVTGGTSPLVNVAPVEPAASAEEGAVQSPVEGAMQPDSGAAQGPMHAAAVGGQGAIQEWPPTGASAQGAPQPAQGAQQGGEQGDGHAVKAEGDPEAASRWWRRVLDWLRG